MFEANSTSSYQFLAWMSFFTLLNACGRESENVDGKLEAVDVAPSLTIATEDDPRAVVRPPELTGVLPQDFPKDVPLFLPASLIDFGTRTKGQKYISLLTSASVSEVDRGLTALVQGTGWSASNNDGGSRLLRKGSQQVRLRIEDARPGTLYHFEY